MNSNVVTIDEVRVLLRDRLMKAVSEQHPDAVVNAKHYGKVSSVRVTGVKGHALTDIQVQPHGGMKDGWVAQPRMAVKRGRSKILDNLQEGMRRIFRRREW
jgi:hypothetical protein